MANSFIYILNIFRVVVNCFQISNFVLWQTAFSPVEPDIDEL